MTGKITNKIKKYFGGNWGHPRRDIKKRTEIPDDFFDDKEPKHHSKKKKAKKPVIFEWKHCPFCHEQLEEIPADPDKEKRDVFVMIGLGKYKQQCKCGAKGNFKCPCCKRDTWYKDGIYKHQWMGCGFQGEKLCR